MTKDPELGEAEDVSSSAGATWVLGAGFGCDLDVLISDGLRIVEPSNKQAKDRAIDVFQVHRLGLTFSEGAVESGSEEWGIETQGIAMNCELLCIRAFANVDGDHFLGLSVKRKISSRHQER